MIDRVGCGCRVMISGLSSIAGQPFNGSLGTVYRGFDEGSGRLGVKLDNGKMTNIRPENTLPMANGVKIQLTGLTSERGSQFNGSLAKILSYDPKQGRYLVELETGKTTRIKPVNAGVVSKDPEVQKRLRKMEGRESESESEDEDEDEGEEDEDVGERGEQQAPMTKSRAQILRERAEEEYAATLARSQAADAASSSPNVDEEDDEEELDAGAAAELAWPDESVSRWQRYPCKFYQPGPLGIVWTQSQPPVSPLRNLLSLVSSGHVMRGCVRLQGDKFDRPMLVVSHVPTGTMAASKDGLERYAVLRKVNDVKVGKKAPEKVHTMTSFFTKANPISPDG